MQQATVPDPVPSQNEGVGEVISPPAQLPPMARGAIAALLQNRKKKYDRKVPQKEFSCKVCGTQCKQEKAKYGTCIKCVRFYNRTVRQADYFAGRNCKKGGKCDLTRRSKKQFVCQVCRYHKCKELGLEAEKERPTCSRPIKIKCKLYECKACGKVGRKNRGDNLFCADCFFLHSKAVNNDSSKYKKEMCPKGGGCYIMYRKGTLKSKVCKWCLYRRCVRVEMESSDQQNVSDAPDAPDASDILNISEESEESEESENPESPQQLSPDVQKDQGDNCPVCGEPASLAFKAVACNDCYTFFNIQLNAQRAGQEPKCDKDAAKCALVRDPRRLLQRSCEKCRFERFLEIEMKRD